MTLRQSVSGRVPVSDASLYPFAPLPPASCPLGTGLWQRTQATQFGTSHTFITPAVILIIASNWNQTNLPSCLRPTFLRLLCRLTIINHPYQQSHLCIYRILLLLLLLFTQTGSLLLSDSISCEFITVPILPNPCTDSLCPLMPLPDTYSHLTPLAVSLLSLLLLLAGVSTLLALCLRRKQRIASEETPPPQGELSGRYEMRREGNLVREPEVKARKKAVPLTTSPAPPEEAEPVRRSIILEKRSSQFSELLSKFS